MMLALAFFLGACSTAVFFELREAVRAKRKAKQ